jgi:hypothetical protein
MPIDLGDPEWFVTVADADTPQSLVQWAGRFVGVPQGVPLPPDGKIDSITVSGLTLWGYLRTNQTNGIREWVIAAPVNPNIAAVNAIPSRGEWTDLTARGTYYAIGQALLGFGVSGPDLRSGLKALHDAAIADFTAAVAAGHIPVPPGPGA